MVRWYFSDNSRLAEFEGIVVENNVADFGAVGNAKVKETSVSFDDLRPAARLDFSGMCARPAGPQWLGLQAISAA